MTETMCGCGKPTAGAVLCEDCVKTFAYSLPNVAAYYGELGTVARKQTRFGSGAATKGSVGKAQPLPVDTRFVNSNAEVAPSRAYRGQTVGGVVTAIGNQLRWDAWNTVTVWCRTVMREAPGDDEPSANTVPAMVNYLSRQFQWIVRQTWAPSMFDEFLNIEKRLARFVDRPADKWYAGRCSARGTLEDKVRACETELYATVKRGYIDCPTCNTRHDVAERRDFLLEEAKGYLVTATEAAGALLAWTDYDGTLEKLVDRIRKWGSDDRGKLEVRGEVTVGGKERTLYRLGDIQDLMIGAAQHAQERRISKGSA